MTLLTPHSPPIYDPDAFDWANTTNHSVTDRKPPKLISHAVDRWLQYTDKHGHERFKTMCGYRMWGSRDNESFPTNPRCTKCLRVMRMRNARAGYGDNPPSNPASLHDLRPSTAR